MVIDYNDTLIFIIIDLKTQEITNSDKKDLITQRITLESKW